MKAMKLERKQPAYKESTPTATRKMSVEREIREELPFRFMFEDLAYIGIISRETWTVAMHYHDHFELCYVDEGKGWFTINDLLYKVEAGDLFFTKPGERHQGAASGQQPYRLYYLGFQLNRFPTLERDFLAHGEVRVAYDDEGTVKWLSDLIFREIQSNRLHSNTIVQGYFLQMMVAVLRQYRSMGGRTGRPEPGSLSKLALQLLSLLHEDGRRRQDVDELASVLHVSRTHLDREFKRFMGMPLGRYIRDLRVDRAKYWLKETEESVSSVAEKLEFNTIHQFTVFFKRNTGFSPSAYRKQARMEPSAGRSGQNDEKR